MSKKLESWYNSIPSTVVIGRLLTFIIGIAAFLRFYQIGKLSFWNDEIATMNYATHCLKDMFRSDPNMSLYYLLIHYWAQIFPNASEGLLRALSAILSVASIPVVFLLGRTMGANRKQAAAIGLVVALLVTLNAYHIQYAQELRSYSLVFLLATLSTFLLIKAIEQPGSPNGWWIWYTIVSAAAVYSHFLAVFVLIAQVASLLVLLLGNIRTFPFKGVVGSGIAMVVIVAPLAVLFFMKGAGQISWIQEPTLRDVKKFAINLTGNQGELLLILYLLAGSIGLLAGARAWLREENLIRRWKFMLMASCLFLPVVIVLVLSKAMTPIFMPYYLLLVLPYLAVLAAVGIVTLASLGWKSRKLLVITIPVGIAVLVLTLALSAMGVKSYFETFQKEDFRGVAQFLAEECPKGLRLYSVSWMERNVMYYNANLKSQVEIWEWSDKQKIWTWSDKLNENPGSEELAEFLPDGYNRVCLVLGHIGTPEEKAQTTIIQTALRMKFPKVTKVKFYGVDVEIYER